MKKIILKKNKEMPVLKHHPWIFSGAAAQTEGNPRSGDVVTVLDADKNFLCYGHYSETSRIKCRVLEYNSDVIINEEWFYNKIRSAVEKRDSITDTNSKRLVFSESDFLPGLIVDQYDSFLVLQTLTPGMDNVKPLLAEILKKLLKIKGIYERNDSDSRRLEGLAPVNSVLYGKGPAGPVTIQEHGIKFHVDIVSGQKTGFYLDQRENRKIVSSYAKGKNILDCFSYTGAFTLYCLKEKAEMITRIDSSAQALDQGEENIKLNRFNLKRSPGLAGNVFELLRKFRDQDKKFDIIILDPPKLAPAGSFVNKASRAYKDINLMALKLLNPHGLLASFSCSSGISPAVFKEILSWAAVDARREVQIIHTLSQGPDHPIRLTFPESEYLKGFLCRVI